MRALDADGRVDFIPVDPYTHAVYPELMLPMPQGEKRFVEALSEAFPMESGIGPFVRTCVKLAEESSVADDLMATESPGVLRERLSTLFRYRRATLSGVFDEFIEDPRLKGVLATLWPYLGLPPSKVSFLYWSTMFAGYTADGAYYCRGTFQNLAEALARGLEGCGGEILYKAGVRRIETRNHAVCGAVLDHGQRIKAPVVISNADPFQTTELLVGEENFPEAYRDVIKRGSVSLPAFVVYIATDLDLAGIGAAHESFYYADFDHEGNYLRTRNGEVTWFSATIPSLVDHTLAPAGEHVMLLTTLMPFGVGESWRTAKARYLESILTLAERHFPGLGDHLLLVEAGSPRTLERYTLNRLGAAYGWDVTPEQVGPNRLPNKSPLSGLFFAGHWSSAGGRSLRGRRVRRTGRPSGAGGETVGGRVGRLISRKIVRQVGSV
ncbi:MAG: NAD(P)/FAD-dependent oxidoreductase [Pseudomonadota bacterium]